MSRGGARRYAAAVMSDDPRVTATSDPSVGSQPVAPAADDELAVLDSLEADLAAVEQAIATLEQVASDGIGGEQAAAQIAAAVSAERFGSGSSEPSA